MNKDTQACSHLFQAATVESRPRAFDAAWLGREPSVLVEESIMEILLERPAARKRALPVFAAAAAVLIAAGFAFFILRKPQVALHPSKGIVIFVNGKVEIERAGKKGPLSAGDVVSRGDRIRTLEGRADIHLANASIMRIRENSDVVFDQIARTDKGEAAVDAGLNQGRVLNLVPKLGASGAYRVLSPTAIASVRGTSFDATAEADTSTVLVVEGAVEVEEKIGGKTHRLGAKQTVTVGKGPAEVRTDETAADRSRPEYAEMQKHLDAFSPAVRQAIMNLSEAKTEDDLRRIYNQEIELVQLRDGRTLRGIVVSQLEGQLIVQSVDGSYVVSENDVLRINYLR